MRGYIALSRVTSADSLLIAQPFNPLLFQMGPQSLPTLLCDVLQGKVRHETLEDKCEEATRTIKETKHLKDQRWKCWTCPEGNSWKSWKDFFKTAATDEGKDPKWQPRYSKFILQPGCLRTCMSCAPAHEIDERVEGSVHNIVKRLHKCRQCGLEKTSDAYLDSMWRNKSRQIDLAAARWAACPAG